MAHTEILNESQGYIILDFSRLSTAIVTISFIHYHVVSHAIYKQPFIDINVMARLRARVGHVHRSLRMRNWTSVTSNGRVRAMLSGQSKEKERSDLLATFIFDRGESPIHSKKETFS